MCTHKRVMFDITNWFEESYQYNLLLFQRAWGFLKQSYAVENAPSIFLRSLQVSLFKKRKT